MRMRTRSLLAWIAVGLIGLALAAGVTYAATQLSSQRIGLSAEPPSAGEELAPPPPPRGAARTTTSTTTTGAPQTPAGGGAAPSLPREERGYRERRAHRGEGFDDRDD